MTAKEFVMAIDQGTTSTRAIIFNRAGEIIAVGPLGVALIIVVIGNSLGGPTGYAINPARDLAPRIAHAIRGARSRAGLMA